MTFMSYAQNLEDVILKRALHDIFDGFYIDVGAQDPIIDSVSLGFYERGWRGIHVEPVEKYASRLKACRPDELVIQKAVSISTESIPFYEIENSGLSTGIEDYVLRNAEQGWKAIQRTVPTITLENILSMAPNGIVHWLKIDVEGMEEDVLRSWGESPVRPWIVLIESTLPNTQIPCYETWEPLLLELGYEYVYFDGLNRFYVSKEQSERRKYFGPGPNIFDAYSTCANPIYIELKNMYEKECVRNRILQENLENVQMELMHMKKSLIWRLQNKISDTRKWNRNTQSKVKMLFNKFEKAISRDEILRGYKLVLEREPENEASYLIHSKHESYDSFIKSLLNTDEFKEKFSGAYSQRWKAYYTDDIKPEYLFNKYSSSTQSLLQGYIVNFIGVKTNLEYVAWAEEKVEGPPIPGNFHATEAEWAIALRAVDLASSHFTVIELGAGWGCWAVNTAIAAKRMGLKVKAIAVEGDKKHVSFIEKHYKDNGIDESEGIIKECVVGNFAGAIFPEYEDAGNSYGQEPKFFDNQEDMKAFIEKTELSYKHIPVKTLEQLCENIDRVDLLHIDIQGGEATLIKKSLKTLNEKVAYLLVGTHGRTFEGIIMEELIEAGWILEAEEPCNLPLPLATSFPYIDGVQGWKNPRLF